MNDQKLRSSNFTLMSASTLLNRTIGESFIDMPGDSSHFKNSIMTGIDKLHVEDVALESERAVARPIAHPIGSHQKSLGVSSRLSPGFQQLIPAGLIIVPLLMLSAPSVSASTINSFSQACAGAFGGDPGNCLYDTHIGDPAISSVSHGASFVESNNSGGINYSAQAAATGVPGRFSLFAHAGGSSDGSDIGIGFASGTAFIEYSDLITITGGTTGTGIMRVPWNIDGGIGLSDIASASFGVDFCQLIPEGSSAGGVGCSGYPNLIDRFSASNTNYSKTWNLDFQFQYNVNYVLNTRFGISAGVSAPSGMATSDFLHTGAMQPVQFFDSFGNPITGVTITSQSGLNYLNPQAVPVPAAVWIFATGLFGLSAFARRKVDSFSM